MDWRSARTGAERREMDESSPVAKRDAPTQSIRSRAADQRLAVFYSLVCLKRFIVSFSTGEATCTGQEYISLCKPPPALTYSSALNLKSEPVSSSQSKLVVSGDIFQNKAFSADSKNTTFK